MRLVLDTNAVISALLWRGPPHQLLQAIREHPNLQIYSSAELLAELADVLLTRVSIRKKLAAIDRQASDVLLEYSAAVRIVQAEPLAQPVCRDPDDDAVLALALAAQADLIVTGDQDLLVLAEFEGMPIVNPRQALERIAQA
jgi:putative PIN family toxin of toxin-antitoxin system